MNIQLHLKLKVEFFFTNKKLLKLNLNYLDPKKIFKLDDDQPFSLQLWEQISNGKSNKIILKDLSSLENEEILRIKKFSEQLLTNEFNRNTFCSYMKKSSNGYTIYRRCDQGRSNCEARWVVILLEHFIHKYYIYIYLYMNIISFINLKKDKYLCAKK